MAETVVNIVIDKLIPLLRDEVTLLRGVHGQVQIITDQLKMIRAYLKDADVKAEIADTDYRVKEWVKQVREVSYRIEDVIDEYLLKVAKRRTRRRAIGVVCKICDLLKTVIPRHEISSQIGDIKEKIEKLNKLRETFEFHLESSSPAGREISTRHDLRSVDYFEDAELAKVENTKKVLADWLSEGDSQRTVILVVGEGGLGKTTTVKNVYDKEKQRRPSDCYAWITVSRSLKGEQLLKTLIQSFYEEEGNIYAAKEIVEAAMNRDTLKRKLVEYLQGRSYMIVFDDVWEIDFWGGVEIALPKDKGRIIITTRDRRVAEFSKSYAQIHIHELEPLHPNDALKLFHYKAFQFDPEGCPKELMPLSQEFVKKCDGVPLAIVAIAGLLSTKRKIVSEWQRVYDSLGSKFSSDPHLRSFFQVLSESYHDLGYHLKLCLLYFGLFPEDCPISCVRLINLWIAEGFVEEKENEDQTLEEVAQEYLAELIARNLVKVVQVYSDGRVRRCRIHDFMHDFILKKCADMNFCQVLKKSEGFRFREWTRRLSIDTNIEDATMKSSAVNYGRVRSCFVFNIQDMPTPVAESLFSSFKLLMRLDCEDAPLDYLPEAVGNLLHLKYLNVRNTKIKTIPKFIGKLENLETLDLKDTQVRELPAEINRLIKLRHLLAYSLLSFLTCHGVKLQEGIGYLRALQKLSMVDANDGDEGVIKELKNLTQMRRLGINKLIRKNGKLLCSSIESMTHLCSLSIRAAERHEVLDLQSLTNPPQHLQSVYLDGRLEKLPEWIPRLKNLVKLRLSMSRLTEDPLPLLKDMSELLELILWDSFQGDELHFREGWFIKMKRLELQRMPGLRILKIDKGAMPHLEHLWLGPCPQMVELPADIQNLEALKNLYYLTENMPSQWEYMKLKSQMMTNAVLHLVQDQPSVIIK